MVLEFLLTLINSEIISFRLFMLKNVWVIPPSFMGFHIGAPDKKHY